MTNNKQQTEHRFCLTPELKCTMSYCDENGCINRQRHLVGDPIEMTNNKQQTPKEQAEELIESFIEFTSNEAIREDGLFYSQRMKLWNAKQCAMIAINKIIEAIDFDWMEVQNLESEHRYWDAVKREIKNYEQQ